MAKLADPERAALVPQGGPSFSPRLYPVYDPFAPDILAAADARARCVCGVIGLAGAG